MPTDYGKQGTDPAAALAFGAMSHRVRALATVHELSLQSASYSEIDLGRYLREMTRKISEGQALAERGIELSCTSDVVFIDYEIANTVGLLANELIANAVRHAFPIGKTGTIHVHLRRSDETNCEFNCER
ncbi:histidine kinase dimerization/phosphoacceptor domain -containing protein [Croceicoccus naphthovorans]|uniref:histidine kinase n=1 Tax=Croceicoccus naphthovorans TaxID=1348774 RepID=A0A0G3XI68_9SPHN|nr:sensor histidine kinase [Croceicoccus naphthovorans]AKM11265.1 hypothetical protein AB433_16825 [Croceicoccus naphthovorans]MBB3989825.1 two-component sensor histidine kinase [Croceicoccus naphthovorans]